MRTQDNLRQIKEVSKQQQKQELQDHILMQMEVDGVRRSCDREARKSTMGMLNCYGPVETRENVQFVIDRRHAEK